MCTKFACCTFIEKSSFLEPFFRYKTVIIGLFLILDSLSYCFHVIRLFYLYVLNHYSVCVSLFYVRQIETKIEMFDFCGMVVRLRIQEPIRKYCFCINAVLEF